VREVQENRGRGREIKALVRATPLAASIVSIQQRGVFAQPQLDYICYQVWL
jgi:hypothetical protein